MEKLVIDEDWRQSKLVAYLELLFVGIGEKGAPKSTEKKVKTEKRSSIF